MSLFNARNESQGFTLIETLIIVIIIGILSAIAAPSFLALLNRSKVDDALNQVRGALQECQREAIRKSKSYSVTLDTTNNKVTGSCLVTGARTMPNGVAMATDIGGTPPSIQFSFRGNTTVTLPAGVDHAKVVLYMSDGSTQEKKCFATSNGIGIMRTGKYSGSTSSASDITAGICTTSQ